MMETAQDSSPEALPQRRELSWKPLGPEGLIHDPEAGRVHILNATARLIWERCDGRTSVSECLHLLRVAFQPAPEVDLEGEVWRLLSELDDAGLLQSTPAR